MWCSICGTSGGKVRFFDMVDQKEIVKVCENCAINENMPVIRRATEFQIKQSERKPTMHERISGVSMLVQREEVRRTNASLRQIIDRNYARILPKERKPRMDLVPNFYWGIMRARRARKVTQEQMAKVLGVPEAAIRLAEQGILPETDYVLARKIENFLGIKIVRDGNQIGIHTPDRARDRMAGINPKFMGGLKIADLHRKEAELFWEDRDEMVEEDNKSGLNEDEEEK